jgi:PAS domain S-box-containing protein
MHEDTGEFTSPTDPRLGQTCLGSIVDRHPDGIVVTDRDGIVRLANPSAEALLDRPAEQMLGRAFDFPAKAGDVAEMEVHSRSGLTAVEMRVVETEWDGKPAHLIVLHDITARRKAAQAEREQRRLAEALRDTAAALNSTLNLDEVLDRILFNVGRVVPHDSVSLMLIDPTTETAYVVRRRGFVEPGFEEAVLALRLQVAGVPTLRQVAASGRPLIIPDIAAYPDWVHLPETRWVRAYMSAPIRVRGRVTGFLNLNSATPGFFTLADADRLLAFADQAALAIENARLFEAEREQGALAEALRDTAEALNSTLDFVEVLDRILAQVGRVVPHDAANIMLIDAPHGIARIALCRGYPDRDDEAALRARRFVIDDLPNLRQMVETGQAMIIADTWSHAGWLKLPEVMWVRSYASMPIRLKGQIVGFLNLDSATTGFFTPAHADRLRAFADQVAVALENAQLFNTAQRRLAEQAALLAASTAVASSLDLATVLGRLAEQMCRAADATSVYIGDWSAQTSLSTVVAEYYGPDALPEERVSDLGVTYHYAADFGDELERRLRSGQVAQFHVDDPSLPEGTRAHLARFGGRSILSVPLILKNATVGYAAMWDSRGRRDFTPDEIALCQGIAQHAAIAFENARLFDQVQRHAAELEQRVVERTGQLDEQRRRMQAILDAAGEGIVFTDLGGAIEYVNPALERITGYAAAEVLGQNPRLLQSGRTPSAVYKDLWSSVARGEVWRGELTNRRRDGALYDAALTVAPLRGADGQTIGYVGVQRDITRQKELDRLKDQFVSNVSHELRTPLANVKLYLGLLERGRPDKHDQYMETLKRETARLEKLITDLLDLSRLDLGTIPVHLGPTDLNALVTELLVDRVALAAERGLTLDHQPATVLPPALADPAMIALALSNLIANAINYTPRGGHIALSTELLSRENRDWIIFTVRDSGPGISSADLPHIFERFYRGEAGRGSGLPGTGLGLAICKEIVDRLGGHISVESAPGQGAAFTVWLRPAE